VTAFRRLLKQGTFQIARTKRMKKFVLGLAAICTGGALFAQTQTLTLSDNGSYGGTNLSGFFNSTDTFTLQICLSLSGWTTADISAISLSYWLQVPTELAPYITITANSYSTFTDSQNPQVPKTFTDSSGASPGFMTDKTATDAGDLGALLGDNDVPIQDGTYLMTMIEFGLNNAPSGPYTLATTTLFSKVSVVGDDTFGPGNVIPEADYMINIVGVPEPSTWFTGLGGLAAIGFMIVRRCAST
jgi:hypothetical protein